jgi:hypothetical protein
MLSYGNKARERAREGANRDTRKGPSRETPEQVRKRAGDKVADRIDGYDRDDLGESPDR